MTRNRARAVFCVSFFLLAWAVHGFTVQQLVQPNANFVQQRTISRRPPPLYYRELDDSEADTPAGIKVQSLTPPGYSTKEALEDQLQGSAPKSGVNVALLRAICANQVFILGLASAAGAGLLIFTDGLGWIQQLSAILDWGANQHHLLDFAIQPLRLGEGFLGALPLIASGSFIERSDKRKFATVNFSTIFMVMTLFGRRSKPDDAFLPPRLRGQQMPVTRTVDVFLNSLAISALTGFCEELVFRRIVAGLIFYYTGGDILSTLLGQAFLFGLGHGAGTSSSENGIVISLQTINGFWFGLLYLLSGGDIVVCMIAHALYDLQTFFFTWLSSNDQIEYACDKYLKPFDAATTKELQGMRAPKDVVEKCKKLFYTFDAYDKKDEALSLSEVRKGIAYLAIETSTRAPPQSKIDEAFNHFVSGSNKLTFPQFLALFVSLTTPRSMIS
mmetsp:Transcript_26571/g.76742  ORF Transcript_26571/g.76742 Transcript_26571/m.76742 type:complete len:444 (+) Transcript_26571:178-1509(+)